MNWIHYLTLLKRIVLLLVVYTLCRLLFWGFNQQAFVSATFTDIVYAFVYGLRFDLSTVFSINILFVLFSLLPFRFVEHHTYQKYLKIFFLASNLPFILINLVDIDFFKFTGRRTTFDIVRISGDVADQLPQLVLHYWYIPFGATLIVLLQVYFYPKLRPVASNKFPWWGAIIGILLSIGGSIALIRNSTQLKPLLPGHAFNVNPPALGNVVLNTPFVLFKTFDFQPVTRMAYYSEPALNQIIQPKDRPLRPLNKQNIVIILLESFASEYLGVGNPYQGYTPFLDSLARQGIFFKHNYANGRRSIEAVPAVLAGVPALMDEAFISSGFSTNEVYGLATALREQGYHTSFFHGGRNGTMGFDFFSGMAGFEQYHGMNEYPDKADYDGNWGIFDEPFLQYFASELGAQKQPFFSTVFTLSSHQPYTIPKQHQGRFPKGKLPIHESIGYGDYALRKFFETAARTDWYKNTLFILTADHTQMSEKTNYQNIPGNYDVPLIFFHPRANIPKADTGKITQHADVMQSVLDYVGVKPRKRLKFGQSVFDSTQTAIVNFSDGHYIYMQGKAYYITFAPDKGSKLYDFITNQALESPTPAQQAIQNQYEKRLKAYIQYYNNGLLDNDWYK